MNIITATITGFSLVITEVDAAGAAVRTITETQPVNFAEADRTLAVHSLARAGAWDLNANGQVAATVTPIDNRFNGTVAARLDRAVGTTHDDFELLSADKIQDGDLITDSEFSEIYVVAGSSWESGAMKVHMVREGRTWDTRHTSYFRGLVQVARKR